MSALTLLATVAAFAETLPAQRRPQTAPADPSLTLLLGRPTDRSVTLSVLSPAACEFFVEYGRASGSYEAKTATVAAAAGVPRDIELAPLRPDTRYYYRLRVGRGAAASCASQPEYAFQTQRAEGHTFTFALQGDSHPERDGNMYDAELYRRTLAHVEQDAPDFYVTLGDDFSIERLISRSALTQSNVDEVYADQRSFLGLVGRSTPLFLVNGNHEEANRFLLDGTANSASVLAARARNAFYPLPGPGAFYTGDTEPVEHVGLLRDYYAWTWGDALFVVIDPYWHSSVQVDPALGARAGGGGGGRRGGGRLPNDLPRRQQGGPPRAGGNALVAGGFNRDLWNVTLGDAQYQWLKRTLEQSTAKYKFVFSHHVLGTGRGGVEMADFYEWGGKDPSGADLFREKRPTWDLPIHQLFVKTGVSVFFQGHDHLFANQIKDGVVYQETPNPADASYQVFNRDAYRSGTILPNAGHLRVTVSPENARIDYVRSWLAKDEGPEQRDGTVAFSYTVKPRTAR